MMLGRVALVVLFVTACGCARAAEPATPPGPKTIPEATKDLLDGLPKLPKPAPKPAADLGHLEELAPGVQIVKGTWVVLSGAINVDQGPVDGLEVFACLKDGKNHEALVRLDTTLGQLVKAAHIAALGLTDGQPASEMSGIPARGTPVTVTVRWQNAAKQWLELPASSLVRDRTVDLPYPALPFVYVGSRFETVFANGPDGKAQSREVFMLDATRSIAVNFDEPDALLASPFPGARFDQRFEAYSAVCPPIGTPIQLVVGVATLPLTIALAADGTLHSGAQMLDDAALAAKLATAFATAQLRAVGVTVAASTDHAHDVAARARIMAAAVAAGVWVVPVFILAP